MSPGVMRYRTLRALVVARREVGDEHPRTFAAFARAVIAWNGRVSSAHAPRIDPMGPPAPLALAYNRALHRASGALVDNRSTRKIRP